MTGVLVNTAAVCLALTLVLAAVFNPSCVFCNEFCGIMLLALDEVFRISHFGKADVMYGSLAYISDCGDEFLAGKPTVRQGVMGTEPALPHAL